MGGPMRIPWEIITHGGAPTGLAWEASFHLLRWNSMGFPWVYGAGPRDSHGRPHAIPMGDYNFPWCRLVITMGLPRYIRKCKDSFGVDYECPVLVFPHRAVRY